jgi:hypothetical protein
MPGKDAPETYIAGYLPNKKAQYRISSQIFGNTGYRISGRSFNGTPNILVSFT